MTHHSVRLACLVGCLSLSAVACSSSPSPTDGTEDDLRGQQQAPLSRLYLSWRTDVAPWQRCYTGTVDAATKQIWGKAFPGGNDSTIESVTVDGGGNISVKLALFGAPETVVFQPCIFVEADRTKMLDCTMTVQSHISPGAPLAAAADIPLDYIKQVDALWATASPPKKVLDCSAGNYNIIRNAWRQKVPLDRYKVYRRVAADTGRIANTGQASLTKGGSLMPPQNWSADLDLDFMSDMSTPEYYDAGVEQMSVPKELASWMSDPDLGSAWTPWHIEIVRLECTGEPPIEAAKAPLTIKLDMTSSPIHEACAQK